MRGLLNEPTWLEGLIEDLGHIRKAWTIVRRARKEGYQVLEFLVKGGKFSIREADPEEAAALRDRGWVRNEDGSMHRVLTEEEAARALIEGVAAMPEVRDGTLPNVNPRRLDGERE